MNETRISLHPEILWGEHVDLSRSRILEVADPKILEDIQPIARVKLYMMKEATPPSSGDKDEILRMLETKWMPRYNGEQIGSANLYDPDDIRAKLGCPNGEYQIVTIGCSEMCDLRPVVVTDNKVVTIDHYVSEYHCAVSLNSRTKHIQISDTGTGGYESCTHVIDAPVFRTTVPWEAGDKAGIGFLLSVKPVMHQIVISYSTTKYGRDKGVNLSKSAEESPEAFCNL